jgi:outer membrane receptor protein involved in Fe transport
MIYARFASGYRPGNANLYAGTGTPPHYDPDKTQNYEIGAKGDFFDHKLSVDASVYYIDWKHIQLNLLNEQTQLGYIGNGGNAKSQGVELSIESRPMRGLTISAWATYDDAVLTQDLPANSAVYGLAGYRLPYSSRISGSLSVQDDFPLAENFTGFVGATVSYVGNREGEFNAPPPTPPERQYYSPYARTDLRLGGRYDSWTLNVFANNVMDKRGVVGGGLYLTPPFAFTYIQPRTIGMSLSKSF